ncbi:hypothetical protein MKUB_20480 [Mycobacterium kubicae]|uniref:HNH nuclease domain-containing protein n=4 Tax=Mycobacterium kubicae TaxID=120959 RepID=A0ABQ1BLG7_9MYCO|nr:hypothetical protein MKUB_20480 [Mycobacterium kubicae]
MSYSLAILARMFELAERWDPSDGPDSRALIARMREAGRAEARAGAARLDAIGELFELRRVERGESADRAVDTWAAVGAEVAAALRTSLAIAGSYLHYARAMRERLPAVAEVFRAGEIDFRLFQTLVYRTDLISDPEVLATADARLAVRARRWPSMTRGRLAGEIDRVVGAIDPDAVRRRAQEVSDRSVSIWESSDGMSELNGRLLTPHASALDERLNALAGTVCAGDPRTREQRRADALGALAANAVRLECRCGTPDCPGGGAKPSSSVIIHVLAEQATVEGRGQAPGSLLGADTVLPAEVIAELAQSARRRPLDIPDGAESGYLPSAGLAAFVRARDLTCRAPGCDRPASQADIDHTVPYADGGPTHPSNLKCLCRHHHLISVVHFKDAPSYRHLHPYQPGPFRPTPRRDQATRGLHRTGRTPRLERGGPLRRQRPIRL